MNEKPEDVRTASPEGKAEACEFKLSEDAVARLDRLRRQVMAIDSSSGMHEVGEAGLACMIHTEKDFQGYGFYEPSVSFILAGRKTSVIGRRAFDYGRGAMILTGMDVPSAFCATDADEANPFVALSLKLNSGIMSELIAQLGSEVLARFSEEDECCGGECMCCFAVPKPDEELLADLERLLDAESDPLRAKLLAPLIVREIHLKLLLGSAGGMLRQIFTNDSATNRIGRAVTWLRENYAEPFNADRLADMVHMAPSTFHRHFKAVTQVSPLQYQKRLRLTAAQRIMMVEGVDAATAAYRVGYKSPAQFSRDYGRLFNESPKRHIGRIKSSGLRIELDIADNEAEAPAA